MPSILFIIIGAGLITLASALIWIAYRALPDNALECFCFIAGATCLLAGLVVILLGFSSIKRVPEDHVRVLSRSGEPFRVMESGVHMVWEIIPYDDHNISRRWRSSSFSPGEGETRDGTQQPALVRENGETYHVNLTVDWRLRSDDENVIQAWEAVRRHSRDNGSGAKLEDRLWHREASDIVKKALEDCLENISIAKADESHEYSHIETCVEDRFSVLNEKRYVEESTALYEIQNVRNVRVFNA